MKKNLFIIALAMLVAAPMTTIANDQKEARKERTEEARKALKQKADKEARKQAKQLEKEGWKVAPGQLPIAKQLDKAFTMQYTEDDMGQNAYMHQNGNGVGQTMEAARQQAMIMARQNLAAQIEADVTTLVESAVTNEQINAEEAASITKSLTKSKGFISQNLSGIKPVVEVYRVLPNKNVEVNVDIYYPMEKVNALAIKALRQNMEGDIENLEQKLGLE